MLNNRNINRQIYYHETNSFFHYARPPSNMKRLMLDPQRTFQSSVTIIFSLKTSLCLNDFVHY